MSATILRACIRENDIPPNGIAESGAYKLLPLADQFSRYKSDN